MDPSTVYGIGLDRVYYWVGGSEQGEWREVRVRANAELKRQEIQRMGYVAHTGNSRIGAPEGPPTQEELDIAHNWKR